jgi:hypothetical protein
MATPTYDIAASVTLSIGGKDVILDSKDLDSKPAVYHLPADSGITLELTEAVKWFNTTFEQSVTLPDFIKDKVKGKVSIEALDISSAGDFDLDVKLNVGDTAGFEIFPGFGVKSLGLKLKRTPIQAILSFKPNSGKVGETIKIGGTGLAGITAIKVGEIAVLAADITNSSNNFVTIKLPALAAEGEQKITITSPAGTITNPDSLKFTVKK